MRGTLLFTLLAVLVTFQSACLYSKTRVRKDPVYEVRRVQIAVDQETTRERVKVGERQETRVERVPVMGPGSDIEDGSEVTIYDERTITTTVPLYEERVTTTNVPRYQWQRHEVGVRASEYQTVHTSWLSVPYVLVAVPILVVEMTIYLVFSVISGGQVGPLK